MPSGSSLWLKFALLLTASIAATLAAYHFGVRRLALLRFLLGMKPRASVRAAARHSVHPAALEARPGR